MKLIVNNEKEMDLMIRLFKLLYNADGFSILEDYDNEEEPQYLNSDEYRLLSDNFHKYILRIDSNEPQMYFEDSDCIQGICKECGCHTEGKSNGESPSYLEYLESLTKEKQEKWICETCYNKKEN